MYNSKSIKEVIKKIFNPYSLRVGREKVEYYARKKILPKIYDCEIEKKDTIYASFQKSGRTWVRFFVCFYIKKVYDVEIEITWNNFDNVTPSFRCLGESGMSKCTLDCPRVIFSHSKDVGYHFKKNRVIFMTRKLEDIIPSLYYFKMHRDKPHYSEITLDEFVVSAFDWGSFIEKINFFSDRIVESRNYIVITFENLKENTIKVFEKIVKFTDLPYDRDALHFAKESSSFENLRNKERNEKDISKESEFHTRKGEKGGGKKELSKFAIKYINKKAHYELDGELSKYYVNYDNI